MKTGKKVILLLIVFAGFEVACLAQNVWIIDDGEKIKRDSTSLRFEQGVDNPIWSPGEPIRMFSLKNETVAFQVVVEAGSSALDAVSVDLERLMGPEGVVIENTSADPGQFVGRYIERFVEHFFYVDRPSGGPGGSMSWGDGDAAPSDSAWTGWMPDALIPVEVAPSWSPYPMDIIGGQNGVIWIDITIPSDQPAGLYTGKVRVQTGPVLLDELDVELEVFDEMLPEWPLKTMYYYDYGELARRLGGYGGANVEQAEKNMWQLFHRHRLTAFQGVKSASQLEKILPKLHGSVFTLAEGYEGPAEGRGDGILSLGTYGGYGEPDAADLANVEAIADICATEQLFSGTDVFVYAIDESCESTWGQEWVDLLASSENPNTDQVLVGWTCSEDPRYQPVDLVLMGPGYHLSKAREAIEAGKKVWIYNGHVPKTGAMVTDLDAVSPRVNGLIQAYYDIERWFQWETTFWYDWNQGGLGAYDPFIEPETFHNQYDEHGVGDGVLVYPGKQVDQFTDHSIGLDGVLASIRLKNIRRGIQDAGYYQLAHLQDPDLADQCMEEMVVPALSNVASFFAPAWGTAGNRFYALRDSLFQIIAHATGTGVHLDSQDSGSDVPRINKNYPNPFGSSTAMEYVLELPAEVNISIYNVAGQRVNTIHSAFTEAGKHVASWNGRSHSGHLVPGGIYVCILEVNNDQGHYVDSRKLVLMR